MNEAEFAATVRDCSLDAFAAAEEDRAEARALIVRIIDAMEWVAGIEPALLAEAIEDMHWKLRAGMPKSSSRYMPDLRADAEYWAGTATREELCSWAGAALRELAEQGLAGEFAARLRKRLLLDLWLTMPPEWQRDFLARVDPQGRWRGAT